MKKINVLKIFVAMVTVATGLLFADSTTSRVSLTKPSASSANWGTKLNTNFDIIDSSFAAVHSTNTFDARQAFQGSNGGVNISTSVFGQPLSFETRASSVTIGNGIGVNAVPYGTFTNDDAPTGGFGEYISSRPANFQNFTSSSAWQNYAAIVLTAGDWNVWAHLTFNTASAGTLTEFDAAISSFSANTTTDHIWGMNEVDWVISSNFASSSPSPIYIVPYRMKLTSTTTVYLKGHCTYQSGTPNMRVGYIAARRER